MAKSTRATTALEKAGAAFTVHRYDYDANADRIGIQAAEALQEPPARVLKTLMVLLDGKPACGILASDAELAMKKLAAALGGKAAEMMKPADAERITGYKVGGISPLGQARRVPIAMDTAAMNQPFVFLNGGQRGLQIRIEPREAARILEAIIAPIAAGENSRA
jgi:Cys-tRNA(Pro)/Cys-tRNA(Cys) deacylase